MRPYDPHCKRYPDEIPDVVAYAAMEELEPDEFIRREEGTFNPANGHFLCDKCYIAAGMPSSLIGWKCP